MSEKVIAAKKVVEELEKLELDEEAYKILLAVVQGVTIGMQVAKGEA